MHRLGNALLSGRCLGGIGRSIKDTNKQIFRYNSSGLPKLQNDDDAVENVETIYRRWLQNPSSVSTGWNAFFQNVSNTKSDMKGSSSLNYIQERGYAGSQVDSKKLTDNLNVIDLIRRYQTRGYLQADLDPLGLNGCVVRMHFVTPSGQPLKHIKDEHKRMVDELRAVIKDDQLFQLPGDTYIGGNETSLPLSEIIKRLEEAYCRHITVEYGHLNSMAQCEWLKKRFEPPGVTKLSKDLKRLTLARVIRSVGFEAFANKKFPSVKRFGVEGGESGIVCLKQILDKSSEFGATCFVMGMAHRGRVNTIANVCRQDLEHVFAQFHSLDVADPFEADVKYHLGLCLDRLNSVTNKQIRCIMIANPSHLECSGSLVMGRTRAEQFFRGDTTGKMVVPILVHGDAALAGQGIVYEIAQFGDVPGFTTFGSIHVVLNNQLGYTTVPVDGRTSEFSTDLAKVVAAPIIRVNGDNPEAVVYAANIAAEWRATWHRDIFIDIVVYRRQGHSEGDEPSFTQPIMYNQIKNTKSIMDLYAEKLISEGVVNAKEIEETKLKYEKLCEAALEKGKTHKTFNPLPWADSKWSPDDFKNKKQEMPITGIPEDVIHHILNAISAVPQGLVLHKGFERMVAVHQLFIAHPFPYDLLAAEIAKYPNAKYVFVQEEHCNQGYHHFVIPRLQNLLPGKEIKLVSRGPGAGGAPGMPATFARQLVVLLKKFIEA
ncbi:2-oxoglutarate dehydrogenase C-terminal [Popillia japonica]|uniref:2-oxoglutarate dehydrogenase, mitochondrial n=1 Tax=Popillia japonica TaxID=7064 RepID=A0AAW1NLA2_POPJA